VLEKVTALDPGEELVLGEEVVVLPLHLSRPARASRRRDGELEVFAAHEQTLDERALPGPRRTGDDEELRPVAQRRRSPTSSAR
jgi:hypothetical protein